MLQRAQQFVDRKYVARADSRQQAMGLSYVTAERQDLAREIVRFTTSELARAQYVPHELNGKDYQGST